MYQKFKEALLKATTKEHREEIMEVKMGCRFVSEGINFIFAKYQEGDDEIKEDEDTKILGRDITLIDLMLALNNIRYTFHIEPLGNHFVSLFNSKDIKWDLTLPAHEQSDKTLEAVYNLIK